MKMKRLWTGVKRKLAAIPSEKMSSRILCNTTMDENGVLMFEGKKIGRYDRTTGIGWCSLFGYIRMIRALRRQGQTL